MFVVRPILWHFLLWLLLAPLLLIELWAFHSLEERFALNTSTRAQSTVAEIMTQRRFGVETRLRYRFQVAGDVTWYSAADLLGRHELWVAVDDHQAAQSAQSGQITVRYLPDDPWVNQPVGQIGNPLADTAAFWLMFAVFDLVWLIELALITRNFLRCVAAAERQQVVRMRFWRSVRV